MFAFKHRPKKVFVANLTVRSVKNQKLFEQGRALKNSLVDCFSDGASRRDGCIASSFYLASRIKISRKFLKTRFFWFFFYQWKKE